MKINHTDLEDLLKQDLETCSKEHDLQQIKSKYLGKKGHVTILFSSLKDIPPEDRKAFGSELNNLKQAIKVYCVDLEDQYDDNELELIVSSIEECINILKRLRLRTLPRLG